MSTATAVVLAVLSILALVAGRRLNLDNKKTLNSSVVVCTILILINAFLRFNPVFEYHYLDFPLYSYIRLWWILPFAIYLFAVGERAAKTSFARLGALFLLVLLVILCFGSIFLKFTSDYNYLGKPDKKGFCSQTTGVSCGAAVAATYLSMKGCYATEEEMANMCDTHPINGTDEFEIIRALREKLPLKGADYHVDKVDYKFLLDCDMPVLVVVKHNSFVDHWVVVIKAEPDKTQIFDPLAGQKTIDRASFIKKWKSITIFQSKNRN